MDKKEPRYVPLDDACVDFVSRLYYVIKEVSIGKSGVIFADIEYSQQIGINPNTNEIVRVAESDILMFSRPQNPVNIELDASGEVYDSFSRKLSVKVREPTYKIPKSPQSFKFKP